MREWIVTNGLGGYASLTHSHETTSKFHGILIASLQPPTKRWVFVSNVADVLHLDNHVYQLRHYRPRFFFDVFPSLLYNIEGTHLKKTFFMDYEKNTTIIKYLVQTDKPVVLSHLLLINSRHFYDTTSPGSVSFHQHVFDNGVLINPSNVDKKLKILLNDSTYIPDGYWEELYYKKDRERNDAWRDHNFHIGEFKKTMNTSGEYFLVFTVENEPIDKPEVLYTKEMQRKKQLLEQAHLPQECTPLVVSSDSFVVKKNNGKSIVAGYHWFSDWGRDTLIALPGITLVTKRFDDAKQILRTFAHHCKDGLLPNVFGERDATPAYNTVDASLWFIDRVYQYVKYTNDVSFVTELWPTLNSIIDSYKRGTSFGIHMDHDFLISHDPGLTWMDVKLGDYYPTPRSKKAVEIQALWYNALKIMSTLAPLVKKEDRYFDFADQVKKSFLKQYDHPYDVIDTKDRSIRPNQIFLVSLDFPMIDKKIQEMIVAEVQLLLVTPFGLRTLSSHDPNYKGSYVGNYHRDLAYHNGTVWPWLLGPFITAFVKVKEQEPQWRVFAYDHFLLPMFTVFGKQWDGAIQEIFDGDLPHAPRGCITQAWSVAEILRCWVEDIQNIRPFYKNSVLHEVGV